MVVSGAEAPEWVDPPGPFRRVRTGLYYAFLVVGVVFVFWVSGLLIGIDPGREFNQRMITGFQVVVPGIVVAYIVAWFGDALVTRFG